MNQGLWIARKNRLWTLVKKVSDGYGGDDIEFVKVHFQQVLDMSPGENIEEAIYCYSDLVEKIKYLYGDN